LFRQSEEQGLGANSKKILPAKEQYEVLLRFDNTYTYVIFINLLAFIAAALHVRMCISFINEADIALWVFARLFENFHHMQYIFESQCV
jgi:hypothetical protein